MMMMVLMSRMKWKNLKIGGKYMIIFLFMICTFMAGVYITGKYISDTKEYINASIESNELSIHTSKLTALFLEKYAVIPEYVIIHDEQKLETFRGYSKDFTSTVKELEKELKDEQLSTLNKMVRNNNELDEFFFSTIVPDVEQIDMKKFANLEQTAVKLKKETSDLGYDLRNSAMAASEERLDSAHDKLIQSLIILTTAAVGATLISSILVVLVSRKIRKNLDAVVKKSSAIAEGELEDTPLAYSGQDEIGQLSESINVMGRNLRDMIGEIAVLSNEVDKQSNALVDTAEEVKIGSQQVAVTIEEMAMGSAVQADHSAAISHRINNFNKEMIHTVNKSGDLVQFSKEVEQTADEGNKEMKKSLEQMQLINLAVHQSVDQVKTLKEKTAAITDIVQVIKSIADHTNLLALNASIEAARAGETGKGFAVVAAEVRKLADEVTVSAEHIGKIISSIQEETGDIAENLKNGYEEVNKGTDQIEQTGRHFADIKEKVEMMSGGIQSISASLTAFRTSTGEMRENIEHIAALTEESAAGSEEITASTEQQVSSIETISASAGMLTEMVERMQGLIHKFKL